MKTNNGFTIPISINSRLSYIPLRSYSDSKQEKQTYNILTLDVD